MASVGDVLVGADGGLSTGLKDELFEGGVGAEDKCARWIAAPEGASDKDLHVFGEDPFLYCKMFGVLFESKGEAVRGDLGCDG